MPISSVSTALDLVNKTSKALSSVREQAKTSKDATLKENISKLYDDFLDLKAVILRLTEEVTALKAVQTRKPLVFRAPFYYQDNDATPFCPAFREGQEERAVHLTKNADGWHCTVCRNRFFGHHDDDPNVPAFNIV